MLEHTSENQVLAIYDVRGIQKYIFKTVKLQEAAGASMIVENIIMDALKAAVRTIRNTESLEAELEWYGEEGYFPYCEKYKDVQVLFIGGGNAYVMYRSRELCLKMNRLMSEYTIKKTYSLQLAVAIVEKSGSYAEDYRKLFQGMGETKSNMPVSKLLGTIPVMQAEIKTGYPLVSEQGSQETLLKQQGARKVWNKITGKDERLLDNYVTEKGADSTIAVVHIDGNSMGQRIRELIEGIEDYTEAINIMRRISYQINTSYKRVFEEMKRYFEEKGAKRSEFEKKETKYFVRKILVAGDDITFVCNGKIAISAVEYYCRKISEYTMTGSADEKSIHKYGFSVCAGIAYINSHFPFGIGYEVAEACCSLAKDAAKKAENMDNGRIGNFVDFHICQNVHAQNLKEMRRREYVTSSGEQLLIRPYYISTRTEGELGKLNARRYSLNGLKEAILYFQNPQNIPRSFAKDLRNTYPLGQSRMKLLYSFLESRGWKMPDGQEELYEKEGEQLIAKWYDALEIMDYYVNFDMDAQEEV